MNEYESVRNLLGDLEVIDFHTHPFPDPSYNICSHKDNCDMTLETTLADMKKLGVVKICGSPIRAGKVGDPGWEGVAEQNRAALAMKEQYGGFYEPGFHVHPAYVRESLGEIERMAARGVKLIGELVPYCHGWKDYSDPAFGEILDAAEQYHMIVSFHSMGEDEMDRMVKAHPGVTFVAAHPGEYGAFMRHMERMKLSENYYLDVSGYGIFRHGMLRHAIDLFGKERFLYGSDFPTCNPSMYLGGVLLDYTLTDDEKEAVLSGNAKRLLGY